MSLDSVDATFNATLDASSPGREELSAKTSNLLKTIYVPSNLDALTTYLPRMNYETMADHKSHKMLNTIVTTD